MSVFDGLADVISDTFGEAVDYTPLETGLPVRIVAIWWELQQPETAIGIVTADSNTTQLSLRAADMPNPVEGDRARRISDGRVMIVTTPISPDGKGLIVCNLIDC